MSVKRRVYDTQVTLTRRLRPENWYDIRWSDKVHFSFSPKGKAWIIQKLGEQYCPDYIQYCEKEPMEEQVHRCVHAWGAVGWNFKSELYFYEVPSNINGKMTLQVYCDEILEKVVGLQLTTGEAFILEEDRDSGHGTGRTQNVVRE